MSEISECEESASNLSQTVTGTRVCFGGRDGEGIIHHWKCWKRKDKNDMEEEKEKKNERGGKERMSTKRREKEREEKKNKVKAFLSVVL